MKNRIISNGRRRGGSFRGGEMKYQCCSRDKVRFEIEWYYNYLKDNEVLKIEITKCPVLKGTFDLKVIKQKIKEWI
jgi:hypothetical protein